MRLVALWVVSPIKQKLMAIQMRWSIITQICPLTSSGYGGPSQKKVVDHIMSFDSGNADGFVPVPQTAKDVALHESIISR
jgi:hypothetical protein